MNSHNPATWPTLLHASREKTDLTSSHRPAPKSSTIIISLSTQLASNSTRRHGFYQSRPALRRGIPKNSSYDAEILRILGIGLRASGLVLFFGTFEGGCACLLHVQAIDNPTALERGTVADCSLLLIFFVVLVDYTSVSCGD